jgi:hypothetical protein
MAELTSLASQRRRRWRTVSEDQPQYPGRIEGSYEGFLELPVPVVLVLLWLAGVPLAGVPLLSLCAVVLYSYWLLLQAVV